MILPKPLQEAIDLEVEKLPLSELLAARVRLTERYRQRSPEKGSFMQKNAERVAYLATRMPATYSAIASVLSKIAARLDLERVKKVLDLGAGPGSVMWAAEPHLPNVEKYHLIEKDSDLILLGKRLAKSSESATVKNACWEKGDLETLSDLPTSDLILLSYSIGELSESLRHSIVEKCWRSTSAYLVIIEPGTPEGFARIRALRAQLLSLGAFPIAPCPHSLPCPISQEDWCHFSQRVERTSVHRKLKEGVLGHEDEKYAYIAVSKESIALPSARLLRHPLKRSGHLSLTLCTPEGIKQEIFSKKNPELYKKAKKMEWGDSF